MRLRTFGGLFVETEDGGRHVALQRKPLAVLALLASAGLAGVSRARLLSLLWPESDEEHARTALRQALFQVRRELRSADVVTGTTQLRLETSLLPSDVRALDEALQRGEPERAVALYHGPFLDGFHVPGAEDFERWATQEGDRLARRVKKALESLATDAGRRGDHEVAAAWWRRLAELDPLDSAVTLRLMRALSSAGDQHGAVRQARIHTDLVRHELDAEPDPAISALVSRLRTPTHPGALVAPVVPPPAAPLLAAEPRPAEPVALAEAIAGVPGHPELAVVAAPAQAGSADNAPVPLRAGGHPRPRLLAATLLMIVAIGITLWVRRRTAAAAPPIRADAVVVLPFAVRGAPTLGYLREGMVELLSDRLDGAGALRTVDPRIVLGGAGQTATTADTLAPEAARAVASRYGAGLFVLGDVIVAGGRLRVRAALYDARDSARVVARGASEGPPEQLTTLADQVAEQLLGGRLRSPAEWLARRAASNTSSLTAFRALLEGEQDERAGAYAAAVDAYRRAVAADTSFALAYYRLSVAADWASMATVAMDAAAHAVRLIDRLSPHDRDLVWGYAAWIRAEADSARDIYLRVVAAYPDDVEAWYQLGEVEYHLGPLYGYSALGAREAFTRVLRIRPGDPEALVHLVRLAAKAHDTTAVDTMSRRLLAGAYPDSLGVSSLRAFAIGGEAERRDATSALRRTADEPLLQAAVKAGVYAENLPAAEQLARYLTEPLHGSTYRRLGYTFGALLSMARGRRAAADSLLYGAGPPEAPAQIGLIGYLAALPFVPTPRTELAATREAVRQWTTHLSGDGPDERAWWLLDPRYRGYVLGLLSLRLADTTAVAGYVRELDAVRGSEMAQRLGRDLALTLRAELAHRRGSPEQALALLNARSRAPSLGAATTVLGSGAYERYLRADLLRELGRLDEARAWYESMGQTAVPELPFLGPAELRLAQLADAGGDRTRAVAHYRRAVELWRDCEPELRPVRDAAARRLRQLAPSS
jgi:DNA-binding SARP family transcriptional activator